MDLAWARANLRCPRSLPCTAPAVAAATRAGRDGDCACANTGLSRSSSHRCRTAPGATAGGVQLLGRLRGPMLYAAGHSRARDDDCASHSPEPGKGDGRLSWTCIDLSLGRLCTVHRSNAWIASKSPPLRPQVVVRTGSHASVAFVYAPAERPCIPSASHCHVRCAGITAATYCLRL